MGDPVVERGLEIRREMFGAEIVNAQVQGGEAFSPAFEDLVTRYCFGEIWAREGLSRKVRSMLTIAMLIALGRQEQLKVHVRGGLANGMSHDEGKEILLHAAVYCGIPAAVASTRTVRETLAELEGESAQ